MQRKNAFKKECVAFLDGYGLQMLRPVGRRIGVEEPTKKHKDVLIKEIVEICLGEREPVKRSNRGAPVKNDFVASEILEKIEDLKTLYLSGGNKNAQKTPKENEGVSFPVEKSGIKKRISDYGTVQPSVLRVESSLYEGKKFVGQIAFNGGVSFLVGLDGKPLSERVVVTVEQIYHYDLREGDTIECTVEKSRGIVILKELLSLNGSPYKKTSRGNFDTLSAVYPTERVRFSNDSPLSMTEKYLEWFLPVGKGQRGLVSASLKSGKTWFLREFVSSLLNSATNVEVFVLLIDQSPEVVNEYASVIKKDRLVYTTFENSDEEHVDAANFLLKRAKRYAESGKDVFLIVDSLTSLAKAYNATELSSGGKRLACGLESKTVRYLKNYLGAARNIEKSGSLAILASVLDGSGNLMDEGIVSELSPVANMFIKLDGKMASKRMFPAVALEYSATERSELLFEDEESERERFIKREYLPRFGQEKLYRLMENADTLSILYSKALEELGGR